MDKLYYHQTYTIPLPDTNLFSPAYVASLSTLR